MLRRSTIGTTRRAERVEWIFGEFVQVIAVTMREDDDDAKPRTDGRLWRG